MDAGSKPLTRKVYCAFDEEGVFVYQAFSPKIVEFAVANGTFGKGFGLDRTSWIKPSFAWTLHRSDYATKHRMEAIARIKIHHWAWLEILQNSVQSHFDSRIYETELTWQSALKKANVAFQWDPERGLDGKLLGRQAIQLGLKAPMLLPYIERFILRVEDVTSLAHAIAPIAKARRPDFPAVPLEREYPIEPELAAQLGCVD
jgi:hypothetical protein